MGLGLGLYIVKRLVTHYQGRIEVSDDPETCFIVYLPLESTPPARDFQD
ncbi:MAG: ATP-binding protein [Planctomycetota bacterium]|jgi:signal transduction histidine kinase|nr:ATP-binding protein [Planctomycetota bacterium]